MAKGFKVFAAFDGRGGAGRELFNAEAFEEYYGRPPKGGEIGCAISHYKLLREFANSDGEASDVMVVAEDDAVLAADFEDVVQRIRDRASFDHVLLAHPVEDLGPSPWNSPVRNWMPLSAFAMHVGQAPRRWRYRLGRTPGTLAGAGLYLVTRQSARKMVDYVEYRGKISWVADDYEMWHRASGVNDQYVLRPNLCGWSGGSEIDAHQPHLAILENAGWWKSRSTLDKLKYRYGRKSWSTRWVNIRSALHATVTNLRSN